MSLHKFAEKHTEQSSVIKRNVDVNVTASYYHAYWYQPRSCWRTFCFAFCWGDSV